MVDHTFVYTGAVRRIKEIIDAGEMGELYYFDSVRVNLGLFQNDIDVIWDLAPHDLSIMDYIIQAKPEAVVATGGRHVNGLADLAFITIYFPGDVVANSLPIKGVGGAIAGALGFVGDLRVPRLIKWIGVRDKKLAVVISGGENKVLKFKHRVPETLEIAGPEVALMCVLLLRGPQTPGELRGRTERMHAFADTVLPVLGVRRPT